MSCWSGSSCSGGPSVAGSFRARPRTVGTGVEEKQNVSLYIRIESVLLNALRLSIKKDLYVILCSLQINLW